MAGSLESVQSHSSALTQSPHVVPTAETPRMAWGPGSQFLQPFFHSVSFLLAFQSISFWFKVARVRSLLLTTNESTPIPVLSRGCTYSWRGRGKER